MTFIWLGGPWDFHLLNSLHCKPSEFICIVHVKDVAGQAGCGCLCSRGCACVFYMKHSKWHYGPYSTALRLANGINIMQIGKVVRVHSSPTTQSHRPPAISFLHFNRRENDGNGILFCCIPFRSLCNKVHFDLPLTGRREWCNKLCMAMHGQCLFPSSRLNHAETHPLKRLSKQSLNPSGDSINQN